MVCSKKTAYVWSLSVIILTLSAAAIDVSHWSTKQESRDSLRLQSSSTAKTDEGKAAQSNTNACTSDTDCQNGGACSKDKVKGNYCLCKDGTSGAFCEIVNACVQIPSMCGIGTDVQCGYDLENERAQCKCNNENKGFDTRKKKCRDPCTFPDDCPPTIRCRKNPRDGFMFCRCPWGIGGDKCTEKIDECKEIGLDCGNNPDVSCLEGQKGEAVCHCQVGGLNVAFDYKAEDCRKCDCGGTNVSCQFYPNGTKSCNCESQYYQTDGKCKACECGQDAIGCKLENGAKKCDCEWPYLDNGGICKECDCGRWQHHNCTFKNGQKSCSCKPGYFQSKGTCKKNCTAPGVECKRGSKCVDSVCQCLPGTKGDVCEIIDGCETPPDQKLKCGFSGNSYCDFNETSLEVYCRCKNKNYLYDLYDRDCKSCDCGLGGNCSFVNGRKTCACEAGYAKKPVGPNKDIQCHRCSCYMNSYTQINCTFTYGIQRCLCPEGYRDTTFSCKDINECLNETACPSNTTCTNTEGSYSCSCEKGYRPLRNDAKRYGCTDIDECLDNNTCPYRDSTECFNTQGSYNCQCRTGYSTRLPQDLIEAYGCEKNHSGMTTGFVILIVVCVTVPILLLILFIKKRMSS